VAIEPFEGIKMFLFVQQSSRFASRVGFTVSFFSIVSGLLEWLSGVSQFIYPLI
jgi:hypothetical protein